jgi:hypothetical protein
MPLATILLISALALTGTQAGYHWAFFQESPAQTAPKPDSPPESPKSPAAEPGKPEQAAPQSAPQDSPSQNPPPKADQKPASPAGTEQPQPAEAPSGDKESAGEKKAAAPGQKCHGLSSGQANSRPKAKIVRRGSTTEPTIEFVPRLTPGEAATQRQSTTQLLASTDANLKKIPNQHLTASQQEAVNQIRKYMQQAKTADASGDLQRARNLAFKARLLSDELLRK